jgi:hypothetical protein
LYTAATISGTVTRNLASTIVLTSGTQSQRCALVLQCYRLYIWRRSATDATVTICLMD